MSKRVLLIESDTAHAREVYKALEAHGVEVRVTGDGKEGLDLARDERPDAIVLCVELPRLSGYSVCQKLKKDGALKDIPVLLTSADASLETFEQHRKLKGRAEEYLLKPFPMQALVEKLAPILGFDPAAATAAPAAADQEVVSLAEVEFEPTGSQLLEAGANPLAGGDDDLKFLDDAFDKLAGGAEAAPPPEAEVEIRLELPPEGEVPIEAGIALEVAPAEVEPDSEVTRLARALEDSETARRELEERLARAEDRVLRAVARLQRDDEARDRVRKALAIAQQLLGSGPVQAAACEEATLPAEEIYP